MRKIAATKAPIEAPVTVALHGVHRAQAHGEIAARERAEEFRRRADDAVEHGGLHRDRGPRLEAQHGDGAQHLERDGGEPRGGEPRDDREAIEPEPAGMALSMRRPVATGVSSPASAASKPVTQQDPTSARAWPSAKRRTSAVRMGCGSKRRWKRRRTAPGAGRVASSTGHSTGAPPAAPSASMR